MGKLRITTKSLGIDTGSLRIPLALHSLGIPIRICNRNLALSICVSTNFFPFGCTC